PGPRQDWNTARDSRGRGPRGLEAARAEGPPRPRTTPPSGTADDVPLEDGNEEGGSDANDTCEIETRHKTDPRVETGRRGRAVRACSTLLAVGVSVDCRSGEREGNARARREESALRPEAFGLDREG